MHTDYPLWETTKDDQVVPIRVVGSAPMRTPATKRSPAALFGITIMVFAGFMMFGGIRIFSAQVVENEIKIVISDDGMDPIEITVKPGQHIRWINNGSIPHVLESSSLKDEKGKAMETTAIFPGSEITYELPASTLDGIYEYVSKTSKKINGRITVQSIGSTTTTSIATTSSSLSSSSFALPSVPVIIPVAVVVSSSAQSSSSNIMVANTLDTKMMENLPVNPNTVGKAHTSLITKNIHTAEITTHRPTKQPESGASAWIVAFCGVAALYGVMKKASISH